MLDFTDPVDGVGPLVADPLRPPCHATLSWDAGTSWTNSRSSCCVGVKHHRVSAGQRNAEQKQGIGSAGMSNRDESVSDLWLDGWLSVTVRRLDHTVVMGTAVFVQVNVEELKREDRIATTGGMIADEFGVTTIDHEMEIRELRWF